MITWLHIYSIDLLSLGVFAVSWLYTYLTSKRKSSPRFKRKGRVSHFYWLRSRISHIDVKTYFLNSKIFRLLDKHFPIIFLLCLGKSRLLSLKLSRSVAYFNINDAFHHPLHFLKILLSSSNILFTHLLENFVMKQHIFNFFSDLAPTKRTFLVH